MILRNPISPAQSYFSIIALILVNTNGIKAARTMWAKQKDPEICQTICQTTCQLIHSINKENANAHFRNPLNPL
jgi:hypothetical protein